MKKSY
jgi:hypothetical protein